MDKKMSINLFEKRNDNRITEICIFAILLALEIVLSRFLSFKTFNIKFSLAFITVVFIARSYGPYKSALFAMVADFIGAILFPFGPYFFGFTVTAGLRGLIWGLFLYERKSFKAIVMTVFMEQLICTLILNSIWISYSSNTPFIFNFTKRLTIQVPAVFILETIVLCAVLNVSRYKSTIKNLA